MDELDRIRERAESNVFTIYCQLGCAVDKPYDGETFEVIEPRWPANRRGTRREAALYWESEHDQGIKLSSWPVFDVEPSCGGPPNYNDEERDPRRCPLHEEYGDNNPMIEEILAASRERKAFKALLAGDGRRLQE